MTHAEVIHHEQIRFRDFCGHEAYGLTPALLYVRFYSCRTIQLHYQLLRPMHGRHLMGACTGPVRSTASRGNL